MSSANRMHSALQKIKRSEVVLPAETPKPDVFIQKMKKIRDHRLQIAEIEVNTAKEKCKVSRKKFQESIAQVRKAQDETAQFWAETMQAFYGLTINSKQFVARKYQHQQLKQNIIAQRFEAQKLAAAARADRLQLQQKREIVQQHRIRVEKLQIFKEISQALLDKALA